MATLTQLALAGAAIWYTVETRQLRQQAAWQTFFLMSQARSSARPVLDILVLGGPELQTLCSEYDDNPSRKNFTLMEEFSSHLGRERLLEQIVSVLRSGEDRAVRYVILVNNSSRQFARDLTAVIYDPETKSYLSGNTGIANLMPQSACRILVSPIFSDSAGLVRDFRERYPEDPEIWSNYLAPDSEGDGFVSLTLRADDDTLHLFKRPFLRDEHDKLWYGSVNRINL